MLRDTLDRFRLSRVERKIEVLRARQRDARQAIKELEQAHRKGDVPPAEYEDELEELEERKQALTEDIKELRDRKGSLEESLEA